MKSFESGDDFLDGAAFFDQAHRPTQGLDFHLVMVEAELMEDRGVEVTVIMRGIDSFVSHFIGAAVDDSALDAAAGHP